MATLVRPMGALASRGRMPRGNLAGLQPRFSLHADMLASCLDAVTSLNRGGVIWMQLAEFAHSGWRSVTPVATYRSVTSPYGRFVGSFKMWPRKVQLLYKRLHEEWGISNLSILALLLLLPLSVGLMCICILDHVYTRRSVQQSRAGHVHYE